MMSAISSRYALWNHPSQVVSGKVNWRITPKSRQYVAVVSAKVIPGQVKVIKASTGEITIQVSEVQANAILNWVVGDLPVDVIPPTVCETKILHHGARYNVFEAGTLRKVSNPPAPESNVYVRVVPYVSKIGPLYKAQLTIVDVLASDVT